MGKVEKKKLTKSETYEALKALFYSGKVKPSLNKILVELENDPNDLELNLLACQSLSRSKTPNDLSTYADICIKLAPERAEGHYYKGLSLKDTKGKEQEALTNFNEALKLDPENTLYLKSKAITHLLLFKDFDLPVKFAEKHRVKAQDSLTKIIELIVAKENPSYLEYLTIGDVSILVSQKHDAKKYFLKAVTAFEVAEKEDQNMNIYKDIIKSQNACIKLINKFTED